ncbi:MAG: peptidylprolyl isomerase [Chloroflexota bacterium]|nr:peptidylprolyl isomerase [Chloroflexota bacterium]
MARRVSNPPSDRPLSRKHLSRAEQAARQRRWVIIGTTVVAVLIVLILAAGIAHAVLVEPRQAMAEVNGEPITREEFYERVNYERFRVFEVFEDTREQYVASLADPQSAAFMAQFFQQQLGQLLQFYDQIGSQTLETMIEERVIEEIAEEEGITVSEEEVDEEIRRQIASQEGALIEADVTATAEARAAATATASLFTPTPEPTLEAGAVITESETLTPTATPAATLTPAPTPTPNILTDEGFETGYEAFLAELQRRTGFTEEEFREVIRLGLLREKVREDFLEDVEVDTTEEQIHVAHILVETEEEAEEVVERLEAGESFEELAAELSTDESNAEAGGDLGWFPRGQMVEAFEEAAFALDEPGEISEPVETQFGWHVIKLIEGPEEREKAEATIEQERNQEWVTFLQNAKADADVLRYWDIDDLPDDPFIDELQRPLPTPPPVPTTVPVEIEQPEEGEVAPETDDPLEEGEIVPETDDPLEEGEIVPEADE